MEAAGESDTRWSPLAEPLWVQDLDVMSACSSLTQETWSLLQKLPVRAGTLALALGSSQCDRGDPGLALGD